MRILYLQYTNPAGYPPLEHSSRIMADLGWEVVFLGVGAFGCDTMRFPVHPRISTHQMPHCEPGWKQKLHFLLYCWWALWWTIRWMPDWIYASDPMSCPASAIASCLGPRLVYHEHDSLGRRSGNSLFMKLCVAARSFCARRAEANVFPNSSRADAFEQQVVPGKKTLIVWNCPATRDAKLPLISRQHKMYFQLFYHGSIVPERVPAELIDALSLLPHTVTLTVVGYETIGSRGYGDQLRARATQLCISERVEFHGAMDRSRSLELCRKHDLGLSLLAIPEGDPNMPTMIGASNKPFDYLSCGLPLLVSDLPDWQEAFVQRGFAVPCNITDPASIAAAIRQFLNDPARTVAMGEAGRRQILDDWNYEKQFEPVLRILNSHKTMPAVALNTTSGT